MVLLFVSTLEDNLLANLHGASLALEMDVIVLTQKGYAHRVQTNAEKITQECGGNINSNIPLRVSVISSQSYLIILWRVHPRRIKSIKYKEDEPIEDSYVHNAIKSHTSNYDDVKSIVCVILPWN